MHTHTRTHARAHTHTHLSCNHYNNYYVLHSLGRMFDFSVLDMFELGVELFKPLSYFQVMVITVICVCT